MYMYWGFYNARGTLGCEKQSHAWNSGPESLWIWLSVLNSDPCSTLREAMQIESPKQVAIAGPWSAEACSESIQWGRTGKGEKSVLNHAMLREYLSGKRSQWIGKQPWRCERVLPFPSRSGPSLPVTCRQRTGQPPLAPSRGFKRSGTFYLDRQMVSIVMHMERNLILEEVSYELSWWIGAPWRRTYLHRGNTFRKVVSWTRIELHGPLRALGHQPRRLRWLCGLCIRPCKHPKGKQPGAAGGQLLTTEKWKEQGGPEVPWGHRRGACRKADSSVSQDPGFIFCPAHAPAQAPGAHNQEPYFSRVLRKPGMSASIGHNFHWALDCAGWSAVCCRPAWLCAAAEGLLFHPASCKILGAGGMLRGCQVHSSQIADWQVLVAWRMEGCWAVLGWEVWVHRICGLDWRARSVSGDTAGALPSTHYAEAWCRAAGDSWRSYGDRQRHIPRAADLAGQLQDCVPDIQAFSQTQDLLHLLYMGDAPGCWGSASPVRSYGNFFCQGVWSDVAGAPVSIGRGVMNSERYKGSMFRCVMQRYGVLNNCGKPKRMGRVVFPQYVASHDGVGCDCTACHSCLGIAGIWPPRSQTCDRTEFYCTSSDASLFEAGMSVTHWLPHRWLITVTAIKEVLWLMPIRAHSSWASESHASDSQMLLAPPLVVTMSNKHH